MLPYRSEYTRKTWKGVEESSQLQSKRKGTRTHPANDEVCSLTSSPLRYTKDSDVSLFLSRRRICDKTLITESHISIVHSSDKWDFNGKTSLTHLPNTFHYLRFLIQSRSNITVILNQKFTKVGLFRDYSSCLFSTRVVGDGFKVTRSFHSQ